nr:ribonuclease H-like domain-containing protein [Tanacetum cinerariifolium]
MDVEQAFWLRIANPTSKPFDAYPVIIKAPKELSMVSLVNDSLKKLKFHLAKFNNVVKIRTTHVACTEEFEKTCKTKITPTGLTEGERGFEQTKECYFIEVIPFSKTLKNHFEGIQKALTTEIKEIKSIFDELEAEVDQNAMNRKCDEIEQKNLLIANDTLIPNSLSKEVFYIATNSELNVSRFSEMHDAYTIVQPSRLELEIELSKLNDKIQKDDHDVMVKRFSNLETTALLTENENLKVQINVKLKCGTIDSITPKVLAHGMYAIDVKPIPPCLRNNREVHLDYLKHLKESVATFREIVEPVRFRNDHFGAIMGYGYYMIGDSVISRVYYVEGLGHNLFFVGQFCDFDLEVAFRKYSCYVCDTDGVELIKEAVTTACYTQNRSLIHTRHNKTITPRVFSGCSRSMTGNKERLDDFQAFHGGKVTFGGGEGRITRKGTICTTTMDFKNVYYVKEL